jgi:hypothetical protein
MAELYKIFWRKEMKKIDLELISQRIASQILSEEFSTEKDRQQMVSKQIASSDLEAPQKEEEDKEKLTDEGEDEGEEAVDIEPKTKPDDDEDEESGDDFEVEAVKKVPENISFDEIKKQINNLRAGKSLKDEAISSQLEDYYDKLGMAEERSLYVFLSSLGAILTGGTLGEEAPRPEGMGVDISIRKKKEKTKDNMSGIRGVDKDGAQAPIVVGESADTISYKLRLLESITSDDKHRCLNGKLTNFGSEKCVSDITSRIEDAVFNRDKCSQGSADRSSLNGTLKYLRQKLRRANKISAIK